MKSIREIFLAILFVVVPISLSATAQVGEELEYEGEATSMYSTPLEDFFNDENPRPNDVLFSTNTANWRGYIGHWKIEDKMLVLTGLYRERYSRDEEGNIEYVDELIPAEAVFGKGVSYPVVADWFSGKLRIPRGERVRYVHMGFGSQHEKEIFLEIKDGQVIKEVEVTYDPERDSYRSQSDMEWVALGEEDAVDADEYDWVDGRLLPTPVVQEYIESGDSFRTRGIYFPDDKLAYLWIPETPKTKSDYLPLNRMPEAEIARGSHVEISAHFYELEQGYGLEVETIRSLKPGETIHHPKYPEIWNDFQIWVKEQETNAEDKDEDASVSDPNQMIPSVPPVD